MGGEVRDANGESSMIIEIPTADDFKRASISQLNLAWQVAMESLTAHQDAEAVRPIDDTPTFEVVGDDGTVVMVGPDPSSTPAERAAMAL